MGKPKKETVRKLRGLMILDQMEDYTPLHKLHNLSNELIETVSKPKKKKSLSLFSFLNIRFKKRKYGRDLERCDRL